MKARIALLVCGSLLSLQVLADGKQRFNSLDANQDGKISEQEYVDAIERKALARSNFKRIDTDGNGEISKAEFREAGRKLKQGMEQQRQ